MGWAIVLLCVAAASLSICVLALVIEFIAECIIDLRRRP